MSVVSAVCCQVEVSASGSSLVQRSPTECGMSQCGREASTMRSPWSTTGCCAKGRRVFVFIYRVAQKERMFFQIIVTLFIFNIKKLCQHQNNL